MKTCAVIPAAGLGSRLGSAVPKILLSLNETETVLSILYRKLFPLVDHIHIVASPSGAPLIGVCLKEMGVNDFVSISIQPEPKGMGDAIFQSYPVWSKAEKIIVVWGDQLFVSDETIKQGLEIHGGTLKTIGLPLVKMKKPYVEYIFNDDLQLTHIKQSREGDICSEEGWADIGTFILSVPDLLSEWESYLNKIPRGASTGEINFLPFLPFLVSSGWQIKMTIVMDVTEARGINTQDDLIFFQRLYAGAT